MSLRTNGCHVDHYISPENIGGGGGGGDKKSDGDIVNASVHPSACQSRYQLLHHWAEFYQTCFITSLHPRSKGVREQYYFPVRSSIYSSRYLFLNPLVEFNQTWYITYPLVRMCESNIIFQGVYPSIFLPRYLQNYWVEFNQTYYLLVGCARASFFFSVCPSSVHHAVSSKTTGRDSTKLPRSLPLMVRVCKSNIIFLCVVLPSYIHLSVTLSPP